MHKEAADAFERMPEMVAEMEKYREESTCKSFSREFDIIYSALKDLMQYMKVDSGDRLPQLLQSIRALESKTESTMRSLDDKLRELKKRLEDTQNHIMDLMCAS